MKTPCVKLSIEVFLSTLSLRRATPPYNLMIQHAKNFYPRSPCGERLYYFARLLCLLNFYPRSPCGERPYIIGCSVNLHFISIHALLAESDSLDTGQMNGWRAFLSTLSLRRATMALALCFYLCWYFYPRSPCGERQQLRQKDIQIAEFLSTLSLRRATKGGRS